MKKSPFLTILICCTIILSSAQLYFLFIFKGKIEKLESNQRIIASKKSEKALVLKNIETDIATASTNIQNLETVISRSFGKYIEIQPPPSFIKQLNNFEKILDGQPTIEDLIKIEDYFNTLIRNTPKWVVDDQFKRLNILSSRLKLRHLFLQAEKNMAENTLDDLIEAFEDSKFYIEKEESEFYQIKIEGLISAYKNKREKEIENILATVSLQFEKISGINESKISDYRDLLNSLDPYDDSSEAIELRSEIQNKIRLVTLNNEIDRITKILENPPNSKEESILELLSQSSSESIALYKPVIETGNDDLKEKHEKLISSIEKKVDLINQEINKNVNERINNYNLWALDSINTFENRLKQIKSEMSMFGDIKKEQGLEMIFTNLKDHLLTIDQNLLLESVREIYSRAYADARSLLDDEIYTLEISKASATANRKTLADTNKSAKGYFKTYTSKKGKY